MAASVRSGVVFVWLALLSVACGVLADRQGRPRLVLKVDAAGEPSVEFLDPGGKVVRRIPEQ